MRRCVVAVVMLAVSAVTGCSSSGPPPAAAPPRTLTVATAASLTGVYTRLKSAFEASHPGVTVRLDAANSAVLAQQAVNGAPIDVLATASPATMDVVSRAGKVVGTPAIYATNHLMIAVAPDNPRNIARFADLAAPGTRVVVAPPQTPCGAATVETERRSGVALTPVSEQDDVTSVVTTVASGNADAGVVFVTDVAAAAGRVRGVALPEAADIPVQYPTAALTTAPQPDLAREWVALVTGEQGRAVLTQAGFGTA